MSTSQIMRVVSPLAETSSSPSGEKASDRTGYSCPAIVAKQSPDLMSQSFTTRSTLPVATISPFGLKAIDVHRNPSCICCISSPVSAKYRRMLRSCKAAANILPTRFMVNRRVISDPCSAWPLRIIGLRKIEDSWRSICVTHRPVSGCPRH